MTIVLRDGSTEPEVLLIERTVNSGDPASGDVALPGGRVDEADGSLASTALRELREEVGLGLTDLVDEPRFVGAFPAVRFGLTVGVFTAELAPTASPPFIGSPTEVAHVFWLPRSALATGRVLTREGTQGPIQVRASVHNGHTVWGFTRRIVREFFGWPSENVLGRPSPTEGPVRSAGRAVQD